MKLPYGSATAGDGALTQLQNVLAKFGCQSFGTMTDVEKGITLVQFRWRDRQVSLEASWKGYATVWLKENPYNQNRRCNRQEWEQKALAQARLSVCSVLRDWVKGQTTAVECGIMSFEAAFMPHILLPTGERLIDRIYSEKLLAAPESKIVDIKQGANR